jgi:hypothetical protein
MGKCGSLSSKKNVVQFKIHFDSGPLAQYEGYK